MLFALVDGEKVYAQITYFMDDKELFGTLGKVDTGIEIQTYLISTFPTYIGRKTTQAEFSDVTELNTIVVKDMQVSGTHGRFIYENGVFYFVILGKNGGVVDGQIYACNEKAALHDLSQIRIGRIFMQFSLPIKSN